MGTRKNDKRKKQEKAWARESAKRDACKAKAASSPKREPKPPREPKQNRRPDGFGFTIFDGGSGKVMQFDNREQGLSAARAMCACDEVDDAIARNDVLNDAMPTVPDDSGVTNAVGHPLRAYGENRMPAHLFPASKMFALMPCDAKDYGSLEVIRDMWVGSTYFKPMSAIGFICSLGKEDGSLAHLWEQFAAREQDYMNAWAIAAADKSRHDLTSSAPTTLDEMCDVLEEAREVYHAAFDVQERVDGDSLDGCVELYISCDEGTERLVEQACLVTGMDFFLKDEGQPRATVHLCDGVGLTCSSAAYLAAAEHLRSHGIGCAPWACWD